MSNSNVTEVYIINTDFSVVSHVGNASSSNNSLYVPQNRNVFLRLWMFLLREIAAEKAWIKSRGVCMWLFNDHLLAILTALIIIFFVCSILFGRKITKRQKQQMLAANAVKSEDYLLYRPFKGQPLTKNTAFLPDLPSSMPIIACSRSPVCLLPAIDETEAFSPGNVKVCHQNVPRYLLPMYEHNCSEIQIPYTPAVGELKFNQPGSPSKRTKRPKPSFSSPAIMNGLWVKLEKVLKTSKGHREDSSALLARKSKSDEEALQCCHQRRACDAPRLKRICSDCQAKKSYHNTMGVAVSGSEDSFGFEDVDLNENEWPSYMYPSRQRFANETIPGNFSKPQHMPKLSTFPTYRMQRPNRPVSVIEQLKPFGLSKHLTLTDSSEESEDD